MARRPSSVRRDENDLLFVKDGVPVKFYFHSSVTQGRNQISRDVERYGGQISLREHDANVLLVDEQEDIDFIRRRYYSSTERYRLKIYVERRGFVQNCIRSGAYHHPGPIRQGMPGRAPGGEGMGRVAFTEEDRNHLAYYLATRFPKRDGRLGNNAYKDLVRLGQTGDPAWAWARRHTFYSWREHYKKNFATMDERINIYLNQLRGVGHQFGHDPRRHDFRHLRQEEEEDEEENEQEQRREVRQQRGQQPERRRGRARQHSRQQGQQRENVGQDDEQQEPVRPLAVVAARRQSEQATRDYLANHERDLVRFSEGEGPQSDQGDTEVAIQGLQRIKRLAPPDAYGPRDRWAKRLRSSDTPEPNEPQASNVQAGNEEGTPEARQNDDIEESQEIEGSDLFGDRTYQKEFDYEELQNVEYPRPFSSEARPPPSTQATLVASPRSSEKEAAPAPRTPIRAPETREPTFHLAFSPSTQQTVVVTREGVMMHRGRVRGPSAEPGPSTLRKARAHTNATAADAPYRYTRSRLRSVEPQQMRSEQFAPGNDRGKGGEVLPSLEEDVQNEEGQEENDAEERTPTESAVGRLSTRSTFEDELVVQELLEGSVENGTGENSGDTDDEQESDIKKRLSRMQDVGDDEPSDSDDAETHETLVRGAVVERTSEESEEIKVVAKEEEEGVKAKVNVSKVTELGSDSEDQEDDEDDEDADRIRRMANGSLHTGPVLTLPQPRVTRSRSTVTQVEAQSQSQAKTRTQTQPQISPRRTRSGNQARVVLPTTRLGFPSPGTKARAVVNRFQEEEWRTSYAPPPGTRAARVVKERGQRG